MRIHLFTALIAILILSSFHTYQRNVQLSKEFVKIPAGILVLKEDSTMRIVVNEFYISAYEISNLQYRTFLSEISPGLEAEEINRLAPDTAAWHLIPGNYEPLKRFYFSNKMFDHYPVVNISHYAANRYCTWLQEKVNQVNPGYDVTVRLPAKSEWIRAAQGGRNQAMFPWSNYLLYNKKGEPLCNFKTVNDRQIYRNRKTGRPEVADANSVSSSMKFTSVVNSYKKNEYGLFNTCGNVAEMIYEPGIGMGGSWNDYGGDVHIRAESKYDKSSPTIGFRPVVIIKKKP